MWDGGLEETIHCHKKITTMGQPPASWLPSNCNVLNITSTK